MIELKRKKRDLLRSKVSYRTREAVIERKEGEQARGTKETERGKKKNLLEVGEGGKTLKRKRYGVEIYGKHILYTEREREKPAVNEGRGMTRD